MPKLNNQQAQKQLADAFKAWGSYTHKDADGDYINGFSSEKGNDPKSLTDHVSPLTYNYLKNWWAPGSGNKQTKSHEVKIEKKGCQPLFRKIGGSVSGGSGIVHFVARYGSNYTGNFIWHFKVQED